MAPWTELSRSTLLWMAALLNIDFFMLVYTSVSAISRHMRFRYLMAALTVLFYVPMHLEMILCAQGSDRVPLWTADISQEAAVAICLLGTALALFCCHYTVKKRRTTLFPKLAVKESLDAVPIGLCYYTEGGEILLSNRAMQQIFHKMTGRPLLNGKILWQEVQHPNMSFVSDQQYLDSDILIVTGEGEVYSFEKNLLQLEKETVNEIVATDITEEYRKRLELEENRRRLIQLRSRMVEYNQNVKNVGIDREILAAKIRIHDDIGHSLLAAKRYLKGLDMDSAELLKIWKNVILMMRQEAAEVYTNSYLPSLKAAQDVGIHVSIRGVLPDRPHAEEVVSTAINECLTNTFRHADGDRLYISSQATADGWIVELSNNGIPPKEEICETGGLKSLRLMAERIGCTMEIQSRPEFKLRLSIPNEGGYHGKV